ncbi:RNA-binding protein, CCR4-NOT complex subunit Rcd1 [Rhizoctonia solani]|uniref:Rcd1-like protein n=1 Tax=Rhizoctonia solani TaxID=456999 RepID=A0A8H7M2N4_9AGAM|nr:Rcd1-like protein [Rhizoctonia solani]
MYNTGREYGPRLNAGNVNVGVNPNMNLDSLRYSTPPPNLGGTTPAPPYGQGAPHHLLGTGGVGGLGNVNIGNNFSQQQQQQALMNMGAQQLALQMQQTMGTVNAGNMGMGVGVSVGVGVGVGVGNIGPGGMQVQGQMGMSQQQMGHEEAKIYQLVMDLMDPARREGALLELSKKREQFDDLALVLWHSFAHIPLFLYPFLNTTSKTRPFEYLRLTSLGVVGALVKQNDNAQVIHFLLSTEIIPLCLRIMETGSELSKTVAIFIVQKILLDDTGLNYICHTYERFYAVGTVLSNMVAQLVENQVVRLLKHVVRCYLRLSDNMRAREALRACLPEPLRDNTFANLLKGDTVTKRCLASLLACLSDRPDQRPE